MLSPCLGWGAAHAASESLDLKLSSGRVIRATLELPEARRLPVPVLLVFGGFQKAAEVSTVVRGTGLSDEFAIASFDYPFDLPRRVIFPESLFWIPRLHQMVRDTIEGIVVLSHLLQRDIRLDSGRTIALGASLGAPMVLAAAARGAAVSRLVIVHGFADLPKVIAWQFERPWRESWGSFSQLAGPASRALAALLLWRSGIEDPSVEAGRLPRELEVLAIRATDDHFVPRSCVDELERSLSASSANVTFEVSRGGHLQPGSVGTLREVGRTIRDWLSGPGSAEAAGSGRAR